MTGHSVSTVLVFSCILTLNKQINMADVGLSNVAPAMEEGVRLKWQLEAPEGIIGPPDLPATTLARAGSTWWLFSISPPKWTLLPRTALCEVGMLTGAFAVKCESPKASCLAIPQSDPYPRVDTVETKRNEVV